MTLKRDMRLAFTLDTVLQRVQHCLNGADMLLQSLQVMLGQSHVLMTTSVLRILFCSILAPSVGDKDIRGSRTF